MENIWNFLLTLIIFIFHNEILVLEYKYPQIASDFSKQIFETENLP